MTGQMEQSLSNILQRVNLLGNLQQKLKQGGKVLEGMNPVNPSAGALSPKEESLLNFLKKVDVIGGGKEALAGVGLGKSGVDPHGHPWMESETSVIVKPSKQLTGIHVRNPWGNKQQVTLEEVQNIAGKIQSSSTWVTQPPTIVLPGGGKIYPISGVFDGDTGQRVMNGPMLQSYLKI